VFAAGDKVRWLPWDLDREATVRFPVASAGKASCLYHNPEPVLWGVADIIMSEYPRITYQNSGRTFDRLFKGTELPLAARFGLC